MRHRLAVILNAVLLLTLGFTTAASAVTARPAGHPMHAVTHARVPAASAPELNGVMCALNGTGYCLNRNHCGSGSGTSVIVWPQSDTCEDFEPQVLASMCNKGFVTETCPFTEGSGLNSRYYNSPIVELYAYGENECVATTGSGLGVLGTCPDSAGIGGSNGTIFVYNSADYVINRYWSDNNYSIGEYDQPAWMCSPGVEGDQVILDDDAGSAGTCQWSAILSVDLEH